MKPLNRSDDIEAIRSSNDIVDVISQYVSLKQSGKNFKGLCPFHKEQTPSFNVNPDNQFFYCFGCGAGGDVFSFIMQIENMTFPEAAEVLAERVGMSFSVKAGSRDSEEFQKRERLYKANSLAAEYFHNYLTQTIEGKAAREYLAQRGIKPKAIQEFMLGYSPNRWDGLMNVMLKKSFSAKELENAGLILANRDRDSHYDRFRDRLIFTIWDHMGRIVGFGGRTMNDSQGPKYLNSPETLIFEKNKGLYGLHIAKDEIRRTGIVVLVEGYIDVISAHQSGIKNVVASMGTSLTEGQVNLISRYAKEVLIAYDADAAGANATLRGLDLLRAAGLYVKIISLPSGMDPDELIRRSGATVFIGLMEKALSLAEYRIELILDNSDISTVEGKSKAVRDLINFLVTLDNAVEEEEYAKKFARELGISEGSILIELEKARRSHIKTKSIENKFPKNNHTNVKNTNYTNNMKAQSTSAIEKAEKMLLYFIIWHKELRIEVEERIGVEGFTNPQFRELAAVLFKNHDSHEGALLLKKLNMDFTNTFNVGMTQLLAEISLLQSDVEYKKEVFDDCLKYIEKRILDEKIKALDDEINILFNKGDKESALKRLQYKGDLMKERGKLSSFQGIS